MKKIMIIVCIIVMTKISLAQNDIYIQQNNLLIQQNNININSTNKPRVNNTSSEYDRWLQNEIEKDKLNYHPPANNSTVKFDNDYFIYMNNKPRYYANSKLNLRNCPGTDSPIIAKIDVNEYVFVQSNYGFDCYEKLLNGVPKGWWYVYYVKGKILGWVYNSYLESDPAE